MVVLILIAQQGVDKHAFTLRNPSLAYQLLH